MFLDSVNTSATGIHEGLRTVCSVPGPVPGKVFVGEEDGAEQLKQSGNGQCHWRAANMSPARL